jgi:hypothetical protein
MPLGRSRETPSDPVACLQVLGLIRIVVAFGGQRHESARYAKALEGMRQGAATSLLRHCGDTTVPCRLRRLSLY